MTDITNRIEYYFKDLRFKESTHTYKVDGKVLPSVSGLIKNFVKPFPKDAAGKSAKRLGLTETQVKSNWKAISDEACDRGNRVHLFGENYCFNRSLTPSCKQEEAVKKFWDELPEHIVPLKTEMQMYHKEFNYAGTADILLYDKASNSVIIADYKTNKDLFKNYKNKPMLSPFEDLLDCPFNKYQLQFSFYQILLEQTGLRVSGRKLIWLQKNGEYILYDTNDLTNTLRNQLIGITA